MKDEVIISIIAIVVSIVAFIVGLAQYMKGQKWKRLEFVANEMKAFFSTRKVNNSLFMLDYNERIFRSDDDNVKEPLSITDSLIYSALVPHTQLTNSSYTREVVFIRDSFDVLFDELSRFGHYVETGLISYSDLDPYLCYWLKILATGGGRKQPDFAGLVEKYLECYGFKGMNTLLREYRAFNSLGKASSAETFQSSSALLNHTSSEALITESK